VGGVRGSRVIYILGRGRSGSTIFAQALGAVDGVFYAGEVRYLWDPVLTTGAHCACGMPAPECPVWSRVLATVSEVDRAEVVRWQREVVRESRLPRLLRARPGSWPALEHYQRAMSRVYAAITEVTGCHTVVDSSKRPSYALVLRRMAGCDPYFLHLVRDPRASAHSWRRRAYRGGAGNPLRPRGALSATLRWDALNAGAELVRLTGERSRGMLVRYEDFTAAPRETVARVTRLVTGAPLGSAFSDAHTMRVPASHAIAGNPARQRTGTVAIREDDRWLREQRPIDRIVASAAALPLLHRYGYRFSPGRAADRSPGAGADSPSRAEARTPR
jgi:Sulfotransferase family